MTPNDFSHRHAGTSYRGRAAWIAGDAFHSWGEVPRGCARISTDGDAYFYRVKKGERRAFRKWAAIAFQRGLSTCRITGAWPRYEVVI